MASKEHLVRREGRYSVRVRVPDDLRGQIGKREIAIALKTSDLEEANRRKLAIIYRIKADFEDRRRLRTPATTDLQWIAQDYYRASLAEDDTARHRSGGASALTDYNALFGPGFADEIRRHVAAGETVLVADAAEHWLAAKGFTPDPDSAAFKQLCSYLQRTELEIAARKAERDRGDFTGMPKDSLIATRLSVAGGPGDARKPLSELLSRIHKEKSGTKESTREIQLSVVEVFEDFLGHKKPVSSITKQDMIDFKGVLLDTPTNRQQRFPGTSLQEAIRQNKARAKAWPTLDPKTINGRYL
jgi:hypothetical protein